MIGINFVFVSCTFKTLNNTRMSEIVRRKNASAFRKMHGNNTNHNNQDDQKEFLHVNALLIKP